MLKCRDLVNQADLLIDGADPRPGQRLALRTHLLICRHCRRYLRQLNLVTDHLRHRAPPAADPEQVDAVLTRLGQQR